MLPLLLGVGAYGRNTGGPSALAQALGWAVLVVGVVGPIFTAFWLARHARRPLAG